MFEHIAPAWNAKSVTRSKKKRVLLEIIDEASSNRGRRKSSLVLYGWARSLAIDRHIAMATQPFIALLCLLFPLLARSQCSCEYCPCQGASSCPVYWPNHQWLSFYQAEAPCGVSGSFQVYSTALFPPDSFTVLAMNISSYEAFVSGEPYSTYASWSSYSSVSCFDSSSIYTTDPGFAVVVSCENSVFQCRVIYHVDWEANINCGNATLNTMKHRRAPHQRQSVTIPAGSKVALIKTEKGVHY